MFCSWFAWISHLHNFESQQKETFFFDDFLGIFGNNVMLDYVFLVFQDEFLIEPGSSGEGWTGGGDLSSPKPEVDGRKWWVSFLKHVPIMAFEPLLSLNKALSNPYVWGGG